MGVEKKRRGLGNRHNAAIKPEDDAAAAERRKRDARIFELRTVQKLSFQAIADDLGIPYTTVRDGYRAVFAAMLPDNVEEVRAEEEANLLRLGQENLIARQIIRARLAETTKDGKPAAGAAERASLAVDLARVVQNAIKISDSRRRLHGADKPVRHELSGPGGGPVPVASGRASLSELLALGEENAKKDDGEEPGED